LLLDQPSTVEELRAVKKEKHRRGNASAVDVEDPRQRARWATKLHVDDEVLAEAVAAVGRRLSKVREYLVYRYFRDLKPTCRAARVRLPSH
jgi:hypothetical protein